MPSLVAEIGDVVESHLKMIGMIKADEINEHQQKILDEKRAQFEEKSKQANTEKEVKSTEFPAGAQLCGKCQVTAVIQMDGCMTCLNCADSKCG